MQSQQRKFILTVLLATCFLTVSVCMITQPALSATETQIKVLDPRGELYSAPAMPINARLKTLDGKKIGILNNTKPGADSFLPYLLQALKEVYPTIEFKTWTIPYNVYPNKANDLKALAAWSDGVIGLLGD